MKYGCGVMPLVVGLLSFTATAACKQLFDDAVFAVHADGSFAIVQAAKDGRELQVLRFSKQGVLDQSFADGCARVTFKHPVYPEKMVLQADGSVIVVGDYDLGWLRSSIVLVRFASDGSLDKTFGQSAGMVFCEAFSVCQACDCSVAADGNITIIGQCFDEDKDAPLFVAKYLNDGSLDTRFGINGVQAMSCS